MRRGHFEEHWNDAGGNPAGGVSTGRGFTISWQNGPLGRHTDGCGYDPGCEHQPQMSWACRHDCTRREPNGAFVEDVIQAVIGRIAFYQASRFACDDNAEALQYLQAAAEALDRRTKEREARAVEGTHKA